MNRLVITLALLLLGGAPTPGTARAAEVTGTAKPAELNVYAAASLKDALKDVAEAWQAQGGEPLAINSAASSVLALQIQEGAPADVFFSADEARMSQLAGKKLVDGANRVSLLSNTLVLIVNRQSPASIATMEDLARPDIRRIVLADPRSVPAGLYAKAYLKSLGLWTRVIDKIIPTESVRAALAAVESGNVDAGIVYRTDARISERVKVAIELPAADGPVISYPVAPLSRSPRLEAARRFVAWLQTEPALAIFRRYGFLIRGTSG